VLEKFLESQKTFFSLDYEVLKIDEEQTMRGAELANKLRRGRETGVPWIVILDAHGNELISGIGPKGNIGAPIEPLGIEHFMQMLEATAIRTDSTQRAELRAALEEFAKPYQAKLGY
jgi:AmiR/NasT family two-component response regulator